MIVINFDWLVTLRPSLIPESGSQWVVCGVIMANILDFPIFNCRLFFIYPWNVILFGIFTWLPMYSVFEYRQNATWSLSVLIPLVKTIKFFKYENKTIFHSFAMMTWFTKYCCQVHQQKFHQIWNIHIFIIPKEVQNISSNFVSSAIAMPLNMSINFKHDNKVTY